MRHVVLGMDIGGSSSRARLRANGHQPIDVEGRGANVATIDGPLVDERLSALLAKLGPPRPEAAASLSCTSRSSSSPPPACKPGWRSSRARQWAAIASAVFATEGSDRVAAPWTAGRLSAGDGGGAEELAR